AVARGVVRQISSCKLSSAGGGIFTDRYLVEICRDGNKLAPVWRGCAASRQDSSAQFPVADPVRIRSRRNRSIHCAAHNGGVRFFADRQKLSPVCAGVCGRDLSERLRQLRNLGD